MNAAASMFRTDRTGLLLIALLGLSLPSLALWSAFRLVNGLAFAPNGTGETLAAVGCVATAIGVLTILLRELRSTGELELSDEGLKLRGFFRNAQLAWKDVTRVETVSYGVVKIHSTTGICRLALYCLDHREKAERLIASHVQNKSAATA